MFGYAKMYYMIKTGWQNMESSELDEEKGNITEPSLRPLGTPEKD